MTALKYLPQHEEDLFNPANVIPIVSESENSPTVPAQTDADEAYETDGVGEYKPDIRGIDQQELTVHTAQTLPRNSIEEPLHPPQSETPGPSIAAETPAPSIAAKTPDQPIAAAAAPRNIIFFGETGVGKSTIINMLREGPGSSEQSDNADVAIVSNNALGCTLDSKAYPCQLDGNAYTLWDTAGLVEGEFGHVTAAQAEDNLIHLLRNIEGGGVSLLVYCIRARRFRPIVKDHYELFHEKTCGREIPILLVATGLEHEPNMEDWWVRNKGAFVMQDIHFADCACITSTRGKATPDGHIFDAEYEKSEERLRERIANLCLPSNKPVPPPQADFGLCHSPHGKGASSVRARGIHAPQPHSNSGLRQLWKGFKHEFGQWMLQGNLEEHEPVRDDRNNIVFSVTPLPRTHLSERGPMPGSYHGTGDQATTTHSLCP